MADRVKYFVLGLLFLVVAGVIAFDRWNAPRDTKSMAETSDPADGRFNVVVGPKKPVQADPPSNDLRVDPDAEAKRLADARREAEAAAEAERRRAEQEATARKLREQQEAAKRSPASARTHVVKSGESLEAIAMRYYKTRKAVAWIAEANNLRNPNQIYAKQKLILPARKELSRAKARTPKPTVTIPAQYEVKATDGDLYAICRKFYGRTGEGARVAKIMEMNQLWSANVAAGTVLRLPPK